MKKKFWTSNKIKLAIAFKIFLILFMVAVFNKKGVLRVIDLTHHLDNIKNNITFLENENHMLEEAILSYRSEEFQIEKIAREDLGLAKENEVVIKFFAEKM